MKKDQTNIVLYMHTINGRPAEYVPKGQICYAGARGVTRFAKSLNQIKSEQRKSKQWRKKVLGDDATNHSYDYTRMTITIAVGE